MILWSSQDENSSSDDELIQILTPNKKRAKKSSQVLESIALSSQNALDTLLENSQDCKPPLVEAEKNVPLKPSKQNVTSSLPLMMHNGKRKYPTTLLVQLDDQRVCFSGDVGAIGRFHCSGKDEVMLDMKGQQYVGKIVPCNTFMTVSVNAKEAVVESLCNDYCEIVDKKDTLEILNGIVTEGVMDDSYHMVGEENVNKNEKKMN